ncbi:MAG: hypothetical protein ACQGVK_14470 [Myxococcota bacterium]
MLWGIWSVVCGGPLGLLLAAALLPGGSAGLTPWAALGAGLVLAAIHLGLARRRDDDPARPVHLAAASSIGWLAAPACALEWLGLPPAAPFSLAVCVLAVGAAFALAVRAVGPCPARRVLGRAALALAVGGVTWPLVSAGAGVLGAPEPIQGERLADAIYDFDARVATKRLPDCRQRVDRVEVLASSGARPRWTRDGETVWYDARGPEGRRQVHRLRLATGQSQCWTCGQPGNNVRPDPSPDGSILVFDSDRHAGPERPWNTELYRAPALGQAPPANARRLTFDPGPDESARLGPSPAVIAWSRGENGRYAVVSGSIAQGHGGVRLRTPGVVVSGAAGWASPLAWSADARSLVAVRGNPYRALDAVRIDLATGEKTTIARSVSGLAGVGFSADGGWLAVATTQRIRAAGALPAWLGAAMARFATREVLDGVLFRGTGLATGPAAGPLHELDLGELGAWGAPSGVALSPSGESLVLGQRRATDAGVEERLALVHLACPAAGESTLP